MTEYREYYHRHLPHWQPAGAVIFVTFRLEGSLPYEVIKSLHAERAQQKSALLKLHESERAVQDYLDERRSFAKWDKFLDKAASGPHWLAQPEIAGVVKEALHYRDVRVYDLYAFSIMSNHAHAVFEPLQKLDRPRSAPQGQCNLQTPLHKIMQSLKRHTARKANIILGREGGFWQDESYDHVIRDGEEFHRIIHYVLENPVKAGLVSRWDQWPWTYHREGLV